jgi:D-sedoheptulose 7-phosphate isomerase
MAEQSVDAASVRAMLLESARVKQELADQAASAIARAAWLLIDAFRSGAKVLLFGNGGSAADAQHLAAEWTGRLRGERRALPALALTANTSELTALGNDYGFDRIFARLIEAHGNPGDVAMALSTSGNSANVLAGIAEARARGLGTIGLTGRRGGKLAPAVDVALLVPSDDTQRIQESHITIGHVLADLVEKALFPRHV